MWILFFRGLKVKKREIEFFYYKISLNNKLSCPRQFVIIQEKSPNLMPFPSQSTTNLSNLDKLDKLSVKNNKEKQVSQQIDDK